MKALQIILLSALVTGCASNASAEPAIQTVQAAALANDLFLLRATTKTPDAVIESVKAYADAKGWQYLGAFKVKQGQVTLVKFCIPEVGKQLWPVGLHLSAMLPCGNLGVYQREGKTEISLLSPHYMERLYPDPSVEKAAAIAEPLLIQLLDTVTK